VASSANRGTLERLVASIPDAFDRRSTEDSRTGLSPSGDAAVDRKRLFNWHESHWSGSDYTQPLSKRKAIRFSRWVPTLAAIPRALIQLSDRSGSVTGSVSPPIRAGVPHCLPDRHTEPSTESGVVKRQTETAGSETACRGGH
jgi:hypothetical protein